MKKLLFGAVALFLMASCSGNGTKEKTNEDSTHIADSIAQVEAVQAAVEQARLDSLRQDSIAKAEEVAKASAQYDGQLNDFRTNINKFVKAVNNWNPSVFVPLMNKLDNMQSKLNKCKDQMTPQQQEEFKSLKIKYRKNRSRTAG